MQPAGRSGRRVGRYTLGASLGGGPIGEVSRAKIYGVAGFEREFALKRIRAQLLQDARAAGVLKDAARRWAALDHPRIARLHEHDLERPDAYLAVELVVGIDAARLIEATHGRGQPLGAAAATPLISRAARAVGYANAQGVVHAGLCPTNLHCTPTGEIKVSDFGLLPARLPARPQTDPSLFARLPFLAPEQLVGGPETAATDVFQLGAIFYQLLTGRPAFAGEQGGDITAAITGGPPPMEGVSRPLAGVLERCLARSPTERFPGAAALADALDAATRGMPMLGDQREAARAVRAAIEPPSERPTGPGSGLLSFPIPRARPPEASAPGLPRPGLGVPNLELDERVSDEGTTDVRAVQLPPAATATAPDPLAPPEPTPDGEADPVDPAHLPLSPGDLADDPTRTTPFVREPAAGEPTPADPSQPEPGPAFGDAFLAAAEPSGWGRGLLGAAALLAVAGLGFFGYLFLVAGDEPEAAAPADAGPAAALAAAEPDAAPPPPDAAPTELAITSEPPGATVYLDGTRVGQTPLELDPTSDRHKLALILPGYELHTAEIDGAGEISVALAEVTPSGGAGGIKVRCRTKNRYYVFIDGRDSGQLCPTERLGVKTGPHVVEIYDPKTDTRRRFDVEVKQTRLSLRVRVD